MEATTKKAESKDAFTPPATGAYYIVWRRQHHTQARHRGTKSELPSWGAGQWLPAVSSSIPRQGIVRFTGQESFQALSAYDQLLRDSYQEEKISLLTRQNRYLVVKLSQLESRFQVLESALAAIQARDSDALERRLPREGGETDDTELDEETIVNAALESAAALGWDVKFEYRASERHLDVLVPRSFINRIALSTLDFYSEMEERLGIAAFRRLKVDFGIVDER
jgi:hypothetical protein